MRIRSLLKRQFARLRIKLLVAIIIAKPPALAAVQVKKHIGMCGARVLQLPAQNLRGKEFFIPPFGQAMNLDKAAARAAQRNRFAGQFPAINNQKRGAIGQGLPDFPALLARPGAFATTLGALLFIGFGQGFGAYACARINGVQPIGVGDKKGRSQHRDNQTHGAPCGENDCSERTGFCESVE